MSAPTLAGLQREVLALRQVVATFTPTVALPESPLALATDCGLRLDDWQAAALCSTAPRALWLACRQSGKSTVAALLGLWVALTQPGSLVLLVAPSERQSAELLRKVTGYYNLVGRPVPVLAEGVLHLLLSNGSRLLALPGRTDATVRGYSAPRLVVVDEGSRVPDELMAAVRPMLATSIDGQLLAMSTPWGCRGWFWGEWEHGEHWERVRVEATQVPRISADFLAAERAALPPWVFSSEYECIFGDNEQNVFASGDIDMAMNPEVLPLFGECPWA